MGYDREEKLMKLMPSSPYRDLLTRKRWPLHVGYWMLVGVYIERKEERKPYIDTIKDQKLKASIERELKKLDDIDKAYDDWHSLTLLQKVKLALKRRREEKRNPIDDEMMEKLEAYRSVTTTRYIRVRDWMELDDCFAEDGEIIENELWEAGLKHEELDIHKRFKSTVDINYCEIPYRDPETGTAYPFATDSEWSVEAFIEFGKREGLDIKWLIEDIRKFNNELADTSVNWSVKTAQRESKYGWLLTTTLQMMNSEGEPRPNDQAVLKRWMENTPQAIRNVTLEGFEFKNASGDWEPVKAVALRSAINRMIE